jgi:serine/threonine-protein phosphatase PGAM5
MKMKSRILPLALMCAAIFSVGPTAPAADAPADASETLHTRTIYLVRHGAYDRVENADETTADGLSPLGLAQARLIGARLRGMPVTFNSLTSSTYLRAKQTAMVIHQSLPEVPFQTTPILCECMPRSSREDVMKDVPVADLDASEAQLNQAFATYFVPAKGSDQNDILVCHGNVIRYLVMKALGVDTKAWTGFTVGNASLTIVQVTPHGTYRVLGVGDVGHIPPNLQSGLVGPDPQLVAP